MQPVISIVITNYNYSNYLGKCIESCINQNVDFDYEVIIIDDGSTDNSVSVAEPYLGETVRLIKNKNSGIEAASNAGIRSAKSDLIVRVDADDYLLPNYLTIVVENMNNNDDAFAYTDYLVVDSQEKILYEEKLPAFDKDEVSIRGDFLATGTVYRKQVLEKINYYDESVKNCGLENYYLILKMIKAGYVGSHIPHNLFAYRRHDLNISMKKKDAIISYGREIFFRLGLGEYQTNEFHPYKLKV